MKGRRRQFFVVDHGARMDTTTGARPVNPPAPAPARTSWRPKPRVRPCLRCGRPRLSSSAADRLHPQCRPAGEQNDGERAGLVR